MYSGIKERINKMNKLEENEKQGLKQAIKMHLQDIETFIGTHDMGTAVLNALQDRQLELTNAYLKL